MQTLLRCLDVQSTLHPLMKKFIIRTVLIQCILLLNGFSYQYANAIQDNPNATELLKESKKAIDSGARSVKSIVSSSETHFKFGIAEIEESTFSLPRDLKKARSFTVRFTNPTPDHFFNYPNKNKLITRSISDLTSNISFATFQVFRI